MTFEKIDCWPAERLLTVSGPFLDYTYISNVFKFGVNVTKLVSNYTLLLYKVKSKFGATLTKLVSNYTLLLYKVKSKFGAKLTKFVSKIYSPAIQSKVQIWCNN